MAVELSKVSLWLDCFTLGAPLSFLDHHVKCGNSLIGVTVSDVQAAYQESARADEEAFPLLSGVLGNSLAQLEAITRGIRKVCDLSDLTVAQVKESRQTFRSVWDSAAPIRRILDLYTSQWFGNPRQKTRANKSSIIRNPVMEFLNGRDAESYRQNGISVGLTDLGKGIASRAEFDSQKERFFHWELEFPDVFLESGKRKEGAGFDAVIGNPPYLRIQGLQNHYAGQLDYLTGHFRSAIKRYDLYLLFLERGYSLLGDGGRLGYICPHKFVNSDFGSGLRAFLLSNCALHTLISFGNNLIFQEASAYTCILILENRIKEKFKYYEFPNESVPQVLDELSSLKDSHFAEYKHENLTSGPWILTSSSSDNPMDTMQQRGTRLGDFFQEIFQGVVTGIDEIYMLKKLSDSGDETVEVFSERVKGVIALEEDILKPMLRGEDVHRYAEPDGRFYCIYPYQSVGGKTKILEEPELKKNYPLAYQYLNRYRAELIELRKRFKTNPKYWYSCHRGRSIELFDTRRIITPEISLGCNMTLAPPGLYHNTKVYSLLPPNDRQEDIHYWLGVLNSKVLWWFLSNSGYVLRGGYYCFKTNYLKPFPIKTINFLEIGERNLHDHVVKLVISVLALTKHLQRPGGDNASLSFQKEIEETEQAIDAAVYELYGFNEREVALISKSLMEDRN